jgi:hypothetical protein
LGIEHTQVLHGVRRITAKAQDGSGSTFMKAALSLCRACEEPEVQVENNPGSADGQPVAKALICPPSLVLSPSPPNSGSDSLSADSSSLLSSSQGPVSKPAREPKPKPRKWTFVPDDWQPHDGHRKEARELRVNLDEEVKNFRNHEFKVPKSNADKAFFRWLATASKGFGQGPPPGAVQHQQHLVETRRRPELAPILPPRPVQEATPLEVLAHVGQVLNRPAAAPTVPRGKMTPAELDRAVAEMQSGGRGR